MMINLFFASPLINGITTGVIVIALVLLFIFEHKLLKSREDTMPRWLILVIYLFSFLLLFVGVAMILWTWGFNLTSYLQAIGVQLVTLLEASVGRIVSSVTVLFVALIILRISKISLRQIGSKPSPNQRRKKTVSRLIRSVIKYIVGIITIIVLLAIWGVNVAPALAGLGILGLVIGLGAQKFINDLISGFFIIFEHHFDVGDKIEVQGFKGEVIDIGLKTTKIKNWKGEVKIVNNGDITSLISFSKDLSVAVVEFGIAYHENVQTAIDLITAELPKMRLDFPEIVEDPKVLGVVELANSSVNIRVMCKTLNEQHYAIEREMRKRIKRILDENGIEIPFPQVVVHQPKIK